MIPVRALTDTPEEHLSDHNLMALRYNAMPEFWVDEYATSVTNIRSGAEDARPAFESARNDANAAGGGVVVFGPGTYDFKTSTTNYSGESCLMHVNRNRLSVKGQGRGSGRSGSATSNAPTKLTSSLTGIDSFVQVEDDNFQAHDWRGAVLEGFHIRGAGSAITRGMSIRDLTQTIVDRVSISHFNASTSRSIRIDNPTYLEIGVTQYGVLRDVVIDNASGRGIEFRGSGPDWEIDNCWIFAQTSSSGPVHAGNTGIYYETNSCRIKGGAVQFWDIGVQFSGEGPWSYQFGRHHTLIGVHFEAYQNWPANAGTTMLKWTSALPEEENTLLLGCETSNMDKMQWLGVMDAETKNVSFVAFRLRGPNDGFLTTANKASWLDENGATGIRIWPDA